MEKWLNSWSLGLDAGLSDFERLKEARFTGIEVLAEQRKAADYLEFAHRSGFNVGLHLPFHDLNLATPDSVVYERTFSILTDWIKRLADYGGTHATFHGGYAWFSEEKHECLERVAERILRLDEVAKPYGIDLLLENLIPDHLNYCHQVASSLDEWVDLIKNTQVKACLDTGHLNLMGNELKEAVDRLGACLGALHLSENDGKTDLHLLPGDGNQFTKNAGEHLTNCQFSGPIIYEINPYKYSLQQIIDHQSNTKSVLT
ncbi:Sugar phosphate isomerase/epimerase [Fictibacillus solisalsi]|uniref:Sugar phosphate isomerase/epimerase n=1 Tax=Fictibacillus solisalsi TaxID=459525 RepID=A0A1G9X905_9BACL|nr:sugar phosphate isomerase/epimerase family protein [Fictibacillus solisalsi]SDM93001.1 Sugar phosphate isomerase/epimerase [Fictibacillus solisalsi]